MCFFFNFKRKSTCNYQPCCWYYLTNACFRVCLITRSVSNIAQYYNETENKQWLHLRTTSSLSRGTVQVYSNDPSVSVPQTSWTLSFSFTLISSSRSANTGTSAEIELSNSVLYTYHLQDICQQHITIRNMEVCKGK